MGIPNKTGRRKGNRLKCNLLPYSVWADWPSWDLVLSWRTTSFTILEAAGALTHPAGLPFVILHNPFSCICRSCDFRSSSSIWQNTLQSWRAVRKPSSLLVTGWRRKPLHEPEATGQDRSGRFALGHLEESDSSWWRGEPGLTWIKGGSAASCRQACWHHAIWWETAQTCTALRAVAGGGTQLGVWEQDCTLPSSGACA